MGTDMKSKAIIVMPAYNAATTLEKTVKDIPVGFADEIILVDDSSRDDTVRIARGLGLTVIAHEGNRGYGANQKTCYDEALKHGADIVIMIHPDYQYDSSLAFLFAELIEKGICDIVLGSRVRTRRECLDSGMPLYKYISNRLLTIQGIELIQERCWRPFLTIQIRMILFLTPNFLFRRLILVLRLEIYQCRAVI
jgi:glycosyltransferase involved in cell wall biosynthesis